MSAYKTCAECKEYRLRRYHALASPLGDKVLRTGRTVEDVVDDYMAAVHERHLSGLSLATDGAR